MKKDIIEICLYAILGLAGMTMPGLIFLKFNLGYSYIYKYQLTANLIGVIITIYAFYKRGHIGSGKPLYAGGCIRL